MSTEKGQKEKCAICLAEFDEDVLLHRHFKTHKIKIADYYVAHEPRFDMHDGKPITFKNKEQYISTDFNSRTNLRLWLKNQDKLTAQEYTCGLLLKRREKKGLVYAPTQVELRSLMTPPISYYNEIFGNYYELCELHGFKNKHVKYQGEVIKFEDVSKHKIFIDTREQKPLNFKGTNSEKRALKFGDYALSSDEASCNTFVERKSINDLIGTLSVGYERFCREIERAAVAGGKLIVLVEQSFSQSMSFNYLPHVYKKDVRATPEFIFRNVRETLQKYPHVQFLFVDGRVEAAEMARKILFCGCDLANYDLQLMYDTKQL